MSEKENCCLAKTLKVIDVLQRNTECADNKDNGCTKPCLGGNTISSYFNTRPITLYTGMGCLFTANYINNDGASCTSSVFRVEKVEGCCVTLMILKNNPNTSDQSHKYLATNSRIIVNLKCMCCLQCLKDIIVDCL